MQPRVTAKQTVHSFAQTYLNMAFNAPKVYDVPTNNYRQACLKSFEDIRAQNDYTFASFSLHDRNGVVVKEVVTIEDIAAIKDGGTIPDLSFSFKQSDLHGGGGLLKPT